MDMLPRLKHTAYYMLNKHYSHKKHGVINILLASLVIIVGIVILARQTPATPSSTPENRYQTVLGAATSQQFKFGNTPATDLQVTSKKENFLAEERPTFKVRVGGSLGKEKVSSRTLVRDLHHQENEWGISQLGLEMTKLLKTISDLTTAHADEPIELPQMEVKFVRTTEKEKFLPGEVVGVENGEVEIAPIQTAVFKPGKYTLVVKSGDRNIEQDFYWGVLAVNTNKSIYAPGETAQIGMAVLDDFGRTKCIEGDTNFMIGKVWVTITAPDGSKEELSTQNGKVEGSDECYDRSVTNKADFMTSYKTKGEGRYLMHVEGQNQNGKRSIDDYFEVKKDQPIVIERTSLPTRTYPSANYTHTFTVKANQNFTGEIVERTPGVYKILDCGGCQVLGENVEYNPTDSEQRRMLHVLVWQVSMQAGETKTFTYQVDPPNVSPEFFLMGPVGLYSSSEARSSQLAASNNTGLVYEEVRQWQVASDAIITWDGGGGADTNWNTAANWSSDNLCNITTETCTFDNTSDNNATINVSIDVEGIDINSGYDGTITQSSTNVVTLYTNGFDQSSSTSTYTGGSGAFTLSNSSFTLSSGTFSSTTGAFNVHINFTWSGGSFTNNASGGIHITEVGAGDNTTFSCSAGDPGTVDLDKDTNNQGNFTLSSGCTLATVTAGAGNDFGVITIDGTMTLTSGTLQVNSNSSVTGSLTIGASATINIERNFNVTGTIASTGTILIDEDSISDDTTFTCASTINGTFTLDKDTANQGSFTLSANCVVTSATGGTGNHFGTFTINGSLTLTSGTVTVGNGGVAVGSSGVLDLDSGTQINIERDLNSTGDVINGGTIRFNEVGTSDNSTFTCNDTVGGTVEIDKDAGNQPTFTLSSGCTVTGGVAGSSNYQSAMTFNGSFTLTSGTLNVGNTGVTVGSSGVMDIDSGTQINIERDLTSTGDVINGGTIRFMESGASDNTTFSCNDIVGGTVEIDKDANVPSFTLGSGCTVTGGVAGTGNRQSSITINGSLTLTSGTLQVESGAFTVGAAGTLIIDPGVTIDADRNWTESTTSVTTNNGTIRFHEDGVSDNNTWTCGTGSNLGDVVIIKATGNNGTTTLASDCTVEDFTRTDGAFNNPASAYTLNVRGNFSMSTTDTFGGANLTINMSGSATQTIAQNAGTFSAVFTVNKSGGDARLTATNLTVTGQACTVIEGTFYLNGNDFTCATGFTVQDGGNFQLWGTTGTETYPTPTLNSGSTVTYTGDGDAGLDFITVTTMTANYHHLTINGTDSIDRFELGTNLDTNGNLTVSSGIFDVTASNHNITVGGNITNNATMSLRDNTVTLDTTTTAQISGSGNPAITFENLTSTTAGKTIQFGSGNIIQIDGAFTITGSNGNPIIIDAITNGTRWKINAQGTSAVTYASIQDSGCGTYTKDIMLDATNSNNNNNESCWRFVNNASRMKGTSRIKGNVRLQ